MYVTLSQPSCDEVQRYTHDTMASRSALLEWCSQTCTTYHPQVEITNLSTSFRDGLAFCAIIHSHRPDLIHFSSLSRANVYENNKLAFEVAESKLGIRAFLIPKEMLATEVPDYLSVITYLSEYYRYFRRLSNGPSSLKSSHITLSNKHPPYLPSIEDDRCPDKCRQHVCRFCAKPVHLIQRLVICGEIWHRTCFRCQLCRSTLAAGFFIPGKDAGQFICSDHVTDASNIPAVQNVEGWEDCSSLGRLTLLGVSRYSEKTKSRDRLVFKPAEDEQTAQRQSSDTQSNMSTPPSPQPVPVNVDETTDGQDASPSVLVGGYGHKEATATEESSESPYGEATGEREQLASKQMPDSVCAAKNQPSQTVSSTSETTDGKDESRLVLAESDEQKDETKTEEQLPSPSAQVTHGESQQPAREGTAPSRSLPFSSRMSLKNPVKSNHPWLGIIHPGPWTQLPPVQSPGPPMHSKRGPNGRVYWYRPRIPPPNPFGEDLDEEDAVKTEPRVKDTHGGQSGQLGGSDVTAANVPHQVSRSPVLPRSLSVPAVKSTKLPFVMAEDNKSPCSTPIKLCKEKEHCDANAEMPKSKTCQALTSGRAAAPGHGFPLIKRKVQADQYVSAADLPVETRRVTEQLEALEERGVDLERDIRECSNGSCVLRKTREANTLVSFFISDKEEEGLLAEWLALTQERQFLMRRDTELVYLTKQQQLEERQADVEYELRRLLNKPESIWSQEDRSREQSLMTELLVIIEQRNQIVSILDQDRKREREEDALSEGMIKNTDFQKEGLKELKKSKGKFKPSKVFKMNRKGERSADSLDKKS
ncbi:MICAL-like protein 1 isoform X3 [Hippocampus zosterae]|uniref:MICAL-like protein 1 isoform X3 n=1 Tax=Hippocampus zosterae TaxID=109293 RepID=UPI00223D2742|nr:MICAL-like protein 1 isoform X3 [Hippocampus zosterae]